jgi:hypothetical protein
MGRKQSNEKLPGPGNIAQIIQPGSKPGGHQSKNAWDRIQGTSPVDSQVIQPKDRGRETRVNGFHKDGQAAHGLHGPIDQDSVPLYGLHYYYD